MDDEAELPAAPARGVLVCPDVLRDLLAESYPLRRPENGYRIHNRRMDVLNFFFPEHAEQLNETATFVLECCDGRHSVIDIWRAVVDNFDVPDESAALYDTVSIVRYFARYQLIYPATVAGEQHMDVRYLSHLSKSVPVRY